MARGEAGEGRRVLFELLARGGETTRTQRLYLSAAPASVSTPVYINLEPIPAYLQLISSSLAPLYNFLAPAPRAPDGVACDPSFERATGPVYRLII